MKNLLTIAILSLCTAQNLEAQTWSTSGNATISGNFLGTTNNMPLVFKVNNTTSGIIDPVLYNTALGYLTFVNPSGYQNTAIGVYSQNALTAGTANTSIGAYALKLNKTGTGNTAIGTNALYNDTVSGNTAIGTDALMANTSGFSNTATGFNALAYNTSGNANTAMGSDALNVNTTGSYNTAFGVDAMTFNNGSYNTANGGFSLFTNTLGSYNSAYGYTSLYLNTTGSYNTASGYQALYSNTASNNCAFGYNTLYANTTGTSNTGSGYAALKANTTASNNTAFGYESLNAATTGGSNVAIGTYSLLTQTTGTNDIGIGYGAYPTSSTALTNWVGIGTSIGSSVSASNMMELGNSSVTSIRQQVASTIVSDGRIKDNIKANVPGLDFINRLRPVTYNLNIHRQNEMIYKNKDIAQTDWDGKYDIEKLTMTGFIAQEVEKAAKDAGYDFSGVEKPATPDGLYGVRYSDFIMPLVKSVQELSATNDALKQQNNELQTTVSELKNMVLDMQQSMSQCCSIYQSNHATSLINTNSGLSPVLNQNVPNPFTANTVISCTIPSTFQQAVVKVINSIGTEVLSFPVQQTGTSSFTVNGSTLASGIYQYTLIIDGSIVDSKKMVLLAQ